MCGVEVGLEVELGKGSGPADERPVHFCAHGSDFGERRAVGGCKGLEGCRVDFGGPVTTVEGLVEEEAHFRDHEGPGDDEGAQEVVCCIGLEGEDGGLGASEDDGFAEVGEHEGEG